MITSFNIISNSVLIKNSIIQRYKTGVAQRALKTACSLRPSLARIVFAAFTQIVSSVATVRLT
jgi:hypothetical protein